MTTEAQTIPADLTPPLNAVVESAPEPEKVSPPPDAGEPERPKQGRFQQRISELTSARRKAEVEARYWREKAEKAQPAQSVSQPDAPTLDQFGGDFDQFTAAQTAYLSEQVKRETAAQQARAPEIVAQRSLERYDEEYQQALEESWQEKLAEASKDPNWGKVALRADLPVDSIMAEHIKSADRGAELLYHLGNNPALAAQISSLPTTQKIAALVRAELSLAAPKSKAVSNAPPPPNPVAGDGEYVGDDPERMSPDQWRKWRNKQVGR